MISALGHFCHIFKLEIKKRKHSSLAVLVEDDPMSL